MERPVNYPFTVACKVDEHTFSAFKQFADERGETLGVALRWVIEGFTVHYLISSRNAGYADVSKNTPSENVYNGGIREAKNGSETPCHVCGTYRHENTVTICERCFAQTTPQALRAEKKRNNSL